MALDEFEGAKRGRRIKDKKRLSIRLDPDLHKELMAYIDNGGYVTAKLIEKILRKFLDSREKNSPEDDTR